MQKGWVPRHKFNARPTTVDNIKFPSQKEARYYDTLKLLVKAGDVVFFLRQVPFHLPGGVKMVIDFQEFRSDGTVHFVEIKGFETKEYIAKKKMVENLYPIKIEVIK